MWYWTTVEWHVTEFFIMNRQCGQLNFWGTHPKTDVPYMFNTKFHIQWPIFYSPRDVLPEVVVVSALRMDESLEMWVLPLVSDVYWTGLNEGYWTSLIYIYHWTVKHKRWNSYFADTYACFGPCKLLRKDRFVCIFQNSCAFFIFVLKKVFMSCVG